MPSQIVKTARDELATRIGDVSFEYFHARWHTGCEYAIWEWIVEQESAAFPLTPKERGDLSVLALRAGGWFVWDDTDIEPRFLPMREWSVRYREFQAGFDKSALRPGAHFVLRFVHQLQDEYLGRNAGKSNEFLDAIETYITRTFGEPVKR